MDDVYDIERIETHRKRPNGKYEYYVKWKGYSRDSNTWEPEENFLSRKMLEEYHDSIGGTAQPRQPKEHIQDGINPKANKRNSKTTLEPDDLIPAKKIKESNWVPEKVLNIFHVRDDEKKLVALIRFKNKKEPEFVEAAWAHENCPQMVIRFYESRIFWRDKTSGNLIKGKNSKAAKSSK